MTSKFIEEGMWLSRYPPVIELPDFTFRPYDSNIKPSLVFLSGEETDDDYPVFMSVCDKIGYDSIGEKDDNHLPEVLEQYQEFRNSESEFDETELGFTVDSDELTRRMDPTYYRSKKFVEPPLDEHHDEFDNMATVHRPRKRPSDEPDRVFNFVGMEDIDEEEGQIARVNQVKRIEKDTNLVQFESGDIVLARIEPSVLNGNVAIAPEEYDEYVGSSELLVIRPKDGIDKQYLFWLLRSPYFTEQAKDRLTGTTGRQRLNREYLKEMVFPVPPSDVQEKIGSEFYEMRQEKRELINRARELEEDMHEEAYEMLESERLVKPSS